MEDLGPKEFLFVKAQRDLEVVVIVASAMTYFVPFGVHLGLLNASELLWQSSR